jgi:hypothetical protein
MAHQVRAFPQRRRYVRVRGPFDAYHLGLPRTPVLIYDLNVGGGFVNFADDQPKGATLDLRILLPQEGAITVHAEAVYRHQFGVAVRFVDVDDDTATRLARTIDALQQQPESN